MWETTKLVLPPLLAVVFVIGLAYVTTRYIAKRQGGGLGRASAKNIAVLERAVLSRETQLVIVRAGEKTLLLSVSPQGARLLCELDPETLTEPQLANLPETDFLKALSAAFSKRKDGSSK